MAPSPLKIIFQRVITYMLALFANAQYPLKIVDEFFDFFIHFIKEVFVAHLKEEIITTLKDETVSNTTMYKINKCFSSYSCVFDCLSTEENRKSVLKQRGFIVIETMAIGTIPKEKIVGNRSVISFEILQGVCVPLKKSFKMFLEVPNMLDGIFDYIDNLSKNHNIIKNIIQAGMWKKKFLNLYKGEIVLPIFLFYDDLEVGNCLGSHAGSNKLGALYISIACLPPQIASRLCSILFYSLIVTNDFSENCEVFIKLIDELNFLPSTVIDITVNRTIRRVKFQLVLILGDNLGLNSILGFVEGFRANYPCRICKIHRDDMLSVVKEIPELLRNRDNYVIDVLLNNQKETGIREYCVFNKVNGFDVTENVTVDKMHDILEGVCLYTSKDLLKFFILIKGYFSLQKFNELVKNFQYGTTEKRNKPPKITLHRLTDDDSQLSMSAAEMMCLVRYLGLIIGHLIPQQLENGEPNQHWELYKLLRQIIDIVTNPRIRSYDRIVLEKLISDFNSLYINLFRGLRPKFHFLIHYPRLLIENGPFTYYWSMRYKSKHRELKTVAQSTSSSKNLIVTIANKQMYKFCQVIHALEHENEIKLGASITINDGDLNNHFATDFTCFERVEISGTLYHVGMFITCDVIQIEKEFGKIIKIIMCEDKIFFQVALFKEYTYDDHYHAYIVSEKNVNRVIEYEKLPVKTPCLYVVKNNTHYVATRYSL